MAGISEELASSLSNIGQTLSSIQMELQKLKVENQTFRTELNLIKKGQVEKKPLVYPTSFGTFKKSEGTPSSGNQSESSSHPVQISVTTPATVPLAPPERFNGDSSKYDIFMNQCQLQFLCRPTAFPDDSAKVAFILSYLIGNAAQWSIPLVEGDDPILYSFPRFKEALRKMFAKHSYMQAIDNELLGLRQGNKDLVSYLSSFKRLVTETKWPEDKRSSLFYRGLNDELKDALTQIVDPPEDWEELIDLVVKIDHRLGERKGEKFRTIKPLFLKTEKKNPELKTSDESEPMQIGGIRPPLTKEEKDKRRRLNLCLYCGRSGHFAKECPVKPKVRKTLASVLEGEIPNQEN